MSLPRTPLHKMTYAHIVALERENPDAPLGAKSDPPGTKFGAKSPPFGAKSPSAGLPPNTNLTPNAGLTPRTYPSWSVPRLNVRVPNDLQHGLRLLAMAHNSCVQDVVLVAIRDLLSNEGLAPNATWRQGNQDDDDVVVNTSTSSVIRSNTPVELLDYYSTWTKNPIRDGDRQTMLRLSGYKPTVVQAGILLSVFRSKTRVGSLKYCVGAIQEAAVEDGGTRYVQYLEMQVRKAKPFHEGEK